MGAWLACDELETWFSWEEAELGEHNRRWK